MAAPVETKEAVTTDKRPFAHLVATPEERERFLSTLRPFDMDAWLRELTPATPEELAELEEWLREREEDRQQSLEREESRLRSLAE